MSGTIEFAGLVVRTTDKALLIRLGDDREVWAPRRAIVTEDGDGLDVGEGYVGTFEAALWWAVQEGITESSPAELDAVRDMAASIRSVKQVAAQAQRPRAQRARHESFGEGDVLEFKGDKVVVRFPTFGVRTLLRSRVTIINP